MTKDSYFEMCELMGTEPIEEEIPIEFGDLHEDVQTAMVVYNALQDNWDSMNGVYLGKVMVGIFDIFKIMEVDDPKTCFMIINILDNSRSEILNSKNKKPAK